MLVDYAISSEEQEDQLQIPPYQRRQHKAAEAWKEIRTSLLHGAVASLSIPTKPICVICRKEVATVLCRQCSSHGYFCEACAINSHSSINILHAPVIQKVAIFVANGSFISVMCMMHGSVHSTFVV